MQEQSEINTMKRQYISSIGTVFLGLGLAFLSIFHDAFGLDRFDTIGVILLLFALFGANLLFVTKENNKLTLSRLNNLHTEMESFTNTTSTDVRILTRKANEALSDIYRIGTDPHSGNYLEHAALKEVRSRILTQAESSISNLVYNKSTFVKPADCNVALNEGLDEIDGSPNSNMMAICGKKEWPEFEDYFQRQYKLSRLGHKFRRIFVEPEGDLPVQQAKIILNHLNLENMDCRIFPISRLDELSEYGLSPDDGFTIFDSTTIIHWGMKKNEDVYGYKYNDSAITKSFSTIFEELWSRAEGAPSNLLLQTLLKTPERDITLLSPSSEIFYDLVRIGLTYLHKGIEDGEFQMTHPDYFKKFFSTFLKTFENAKLCAVSIAHEQYVWKEEKRDGYIEDTLAEVIKNKGTTVTRLFLLENEPIEGTHEFNVLTLQNDINVDVFYKIIPDLYTKIRNDYKNHPLYLVSSNLKAGWTVDELNDLSIAKVTVSTRREVTKKLYDDFKIKIHGATRFGSELDTEKLIT